MCHKNRGLFCPLFFYLKTSLLSAPLPSSSLYFKKKWAEETHPVVTLRIIGSIIAAKAFPGVVFGMTPAKGFERVAPAEKRMNPSKFTTF